MRRTIEEQRLPTTRGALTFTVSVGIAYTEAGEEIQAQQLFESADRALYAAKDAGRNAVSIAPSAP
jgi:diguanylate cyclase (GGDEF)-like protein